VKSQNSRKNVFQAITISDKLMLFSKPQLMFNTNLNILFSKIKSHDDLLARLRDEKIPIQYLIGTVIGGGI
jgi:hypothetical protein